MATIRTAIALYDGVTSPLQSMHRAMNIMINSFEVMQNASGRAVDIRGFQEAREELSKVGVAFDHIKEKIQEADRRQQGFNERVKKGTSAADGLWSKIKGIAATLGVTTGL